MTPANGRKRRLPLDQARLEQLALRYVERFATTRSKLRDYLARKLRERGWSDTEQPDLDRLAETFADRGYVDDGAYALSRARSLVGRGYGERRLADKLRAAGVDEADSQAARDHAQEQAVDAAIRFAQRRRVGPFAAAAPSDRREKEKALAAMVRAGHDFALARAVLALAPGSAIDVEELRQFARGG